MPTELPSRPQQGRVFVASQRAVGLGDVRPSGRARLDAIARYLQDVSADDTADAALPDAQAWVVRRVVVEVRGFPRYLERLDATTWCCGVGSHFAERRVELRGEHGAVVDAVSLWVHVDPADGRPKRLQPSFTERYATAADGRRAASRLHHAEAPAEASFEPWPQRARDHDLWGHMNNAAYWEVVEQALAREPAPRGDLRAEVEHRIAVEPAHEVTWAWAPNEAGGIDVWIRADGALAATAVVWPIA